MPDLNAQIAREPLSTPCAGGDPFRGLPTAPSLLRLATDLQRLPIDPFADPDGEWDYDSLVQRAGFDALPGAVTIAALTEPYAGFPAGAAVVALTQGTTTSIALVDCTRSSESDAVTAPS